MDMREFTSGGKLQSIIQRRRNIKAALKAVEQRLREQERSDALRLESIVGSRVLAAAEQSAEIKSFVQQILNAADLSRPDRAFLITKSWLKETA